MAPPESGDLTEVTQLFNSMKRDMRDKHIHIKECHKSNARRIRAVDVEP